MQLAGERQWKHVVDDHFKKKSLKKERNAAGWRKTTRVRCRRPGNKKNLKKEMQLAMEASLSTTIIVFYFLFF